MTDTTTGTGFPLSYIPALMARETMELDPIRCRGRMTELLGPLIKAVMPRVKLGELCALRGKGNRRIWAEVIGFADGQVMLTPITETDGLSAGAQVIPMGRDHRIQVGSFLLGQVLDGMGQPLADGGGDFTALDGYPVYNDPPNAMTRSPIDKPLITGIRVMDSLLTCGVGQRIGIFAAAGGGKSTLLASLMRNAQADIFVLALIGERGREVREFLDREMTPEIRERVVLVVATSDKPAMQRVRAAYVATAVAESFRDAGHHVLLMMDSVTRFARALREVGLAAGEAPTRRGYPASTFAVLPKLLERAGPASVGAITAMYTVLVEGDDMNEPVADEVRGLVDGHIVLSRDLAKANHYPAIDALQSVSRVMNNIVSEEHLKYAGRIRNLMAKHKDIELILQMGEYKKGADRDTDEAVAKHDTIMRFLKQGTEETSDFETTLKTMEEICGNGTA